MKMPIRIVIPLTRFDTIAQRCVHATLREAARVHAAVVVVLNDPAPSALEQLRRQFVDTPVVIRQQGQVRSAGATRNEGARGFPSGILIFVDADVEVQAGALTKLLQPILDGDAVATVGSYSQDTSRLCFAQSYKQLYVALIYSRRAGRIQNEFWSALGAIDASIFHALGGFDEQIPGAGGEDTILGYHLTRRGHAIVAVPEAKARHLHPFTIVGLVKNDFRKAMLTVRNAQHFRVPLCANRHATTRDMLAVGSALLTLGALSVLALWPAAGMVGAITALLLYTSCRGDLLRIAARQGAWFAIRSLALAFTLDLIRAAAVLCARIGQRPTPTA